MVECKVNIVEAFDLDQLFGIEEVEDRKLPLEKYITVKVVCDLGNIVEIDASVPHGLETEDGNSHFVVRKDLIKFN